MKVFKKQKLYLGPVAQKILLLLAGGLSLSLTQRPDVYFSIIKEMAKEWRNINQRTLHEAIKRLYHSKLIGYRENNDGTVTLTLNNDGRRRALRYNLDTIKIKRPARWDGLWRIVVFDVPEHLKQGRNALSAKLKALGFYPLQKSVFIYPYECQDEVNFIVEIFGLQPYVRMIIAKKTDIDLDLKNKFSINNK